MPDNTVGQLAKTIIKKFYAHTADHVFTVAVSGIDASGKGFVAKLLEDALRRKGLNVANINIDPWQNPIPVRLQKENAAENVYENIFRWEDFFNALIFPLKKNRSICLKTKGIRSDADVYYPLIYDYSSVDILLIEGIFLLKKKYLGHYDYRIWIDCSFKTGLIRALKRNAEKLDKKSLVHDYDAFYYAAQRLHFEKDKPWLSADKIFKNDPLLKNGA